MSARISHGPSLSPAESGIGLIQLSLLDRKAVSSWITAYPSPTFSNTTFGVGLSLRKEKLGNVATIRLLYHQTAEDLSSKCQVAQIGLYRHRKLDDRPPLASVIRMPLHVIDYEDFDWALAQFELEPELFLHRCKQRGP